MKIAGQTFGIIRATSAVAEFLVHVQIGGPASGCTVTGRAVGPRCEGVSTVEVAYPLRVLEMRDTTVSLRCVIPEPNLWKPETPFTYAVSVELRANGVVVDSRISTLALKNR